MQVVEPNETDLNHRPVPKQSAVNGDDYMGVVPRPEPFWDATVVKGQTPAARNMKAPAEFNVERPDWQLCSSGAVGREGKTNRGSRRGWGRSAQGNWWPALAEN